MNYLNQPILFKIRKVARYVALYGPRRTWVKALAQVHMARQMSPKPPPHVAACKRHDVAVIGCGQYGFSNIAYYLKKNFGHVIRACMDVDPARAASFARQYRVPVWTTDASTLFESKDIRLVYIASNHASHAEYAIQALRANKDVYIEKPQVVNEDQLIRLIGAMEDAPGQVFLGFNRPESRFGRLIREHLDREPGTAMFNWFVAGHQIDPGHWYFRPEEGGRVLGNLCHWTDFLLRMVPAEAQFPIRVTPVRAEKSDSDIVVTFTFGDGSIGVISFSAKGHTFEGVREKFSAHKGNCLISMDDFRRLRIDVTHVRKRYFNLFRDHGHERNITRAYAAGRDLAGNKQELLRYVWNSGMLFLKTKEALEAGREMVIQDFDRSYRANRPAESISGMSRH